MGRMIGATGHPPTFEQAMELCVGPGGGSEFASDEERELAWRTHGEDLTSNSGARIGDKWWAAWRYDLGVEEPDSYLEKVRLLEQRGLLSEEERRKIIASAEHTRRAPPCQSFVSPPEAAESLKRMEREHKEEAIALLEALGVET